MYYRTGSLGGLTMRYVLGRLDWELGRGYHKLGIWERIVHEIRKLIIVAEDKDMEQKMNLLTKQQINKEISLLLERHGVKEPQK